MDENKDIAMEETTTDIAETPAAVAPVPNRVVVDTGLETVEICDLKGDTIGHLSFRPADMGIAERWNNMVQSFDDILKPIENMSETGTGAYEALAQSKELLCEALDAVFDGNVSEAFFSKVHPFALANGRFYCENVMDAVAGYMGQRFQAEFDKINSAQAAKMAAYTKDARKPRKTKKASQK